MVQESKLHTSFIDGKRATHPAGEDLAVAESCKEVFLAFLGQNRFGGAPYTGVLLTAHIQNHLIILWTEICGQTDVWTSSGILVLVLWLFDGTQDEQQRGHSMLFCTRMTWLIRGGASTNTH